MKRLLVLLVLGSVLVLAIGGCPGNPPPPEPEVVIDTTPPPEPTPEPTPPPPPPPPAPKLQESQLATVLFDFDKYNLRTDALGALDGNVTMLKKFPNAIVKLEGHCDERGTVEYNIALGEKRANSVMQYLVDRGIDASRMSVISYGKERPVDTGHDEKAWSKNRRVEFRIISQ